MSKQMEVAVWKCASIFWLLFAIFLSNMPSIICRAITQGGNDHEIFESEKTIGHTGKLAFLYIWSSFSDMLLSLVHSLSTLLVILLDVVISEHGIH